MSTAATLRAVVLPDAEAQRRYDALVGLDEVKRELGNALHVALIPDEFRKWAERQSGLKPVVELMLSRPPLFILSGDVGTGKTELAQTIGDAVARSARISVTLFSLSLAARGTGFVGEMTQRIVAAFDEVREWGEKRRSGGTTRGAGVLFIDEADAIAQSRESAQMHHEDRAGVNALIRGIDEIAAARIPVAVIMATNRLGALDPAVRRRSALVFAFGRPDGVQLKALLERLFPSWSDKDIEQLLTVARGNSKEIGFSYSDVVQRIVPRAALAAFAADVDLSVNHVLQALLATDPTPRFGDFT